MYTQQKYKLNAGTTTEMAEFLVLASTVMCNGKGNTSWSSEILKQPAWKAEVIQSWRWVNISLSGDTAQWSPQGKTHPQEKKPLNFMAPSCLVPRDLTRWSEWEVLGSRIESKQKAQMERRLLWEEIQWGGSEVRMEVEGQQLKS